MMAASEEMKYEIAAKYRDLRKTVLTLSEQQKMATAADLDVDIFGYYREGARLALQLFTMREGKVVGRREFFWEDLPEDDFDPSLFLSEVLTQYYSTDYVPREIDVPVDFEDREALIALRHLKEFRRALFIAAPDAPLAVRLYGGSSVVLPPENDHRNVLLVLRIGPVLELRSDPVPAEAADVALWHAFGFRMSVALPAGDWAG